MSTERTAKSYNTLGNGIKITFTGTGYSGEPLLDTEVKVEGGVLCAITWEKQHEFLQELENVINKYRI